MNQPETSLENRVLALEARVLALEKSVAGSPKKSHQAKSFANDVSESHLNIRLDLLSLLEDHIEVLKLVHTTVGPTDRNKNKLVLTYIRRAESKLGEFQVRLAQLEDTRKRLENGASSNLLPPPVKPRRMSLLKTSALNHVLRSLSWSNR